MSQPVKGLKNDFERVEVGSGEELRAWLAANHTRPIGVWLVTYKKSSPKYVSREAAIDELLCFGWIDSRISALDAERTMVMISPRRPGSGWSKVNKDKVARLIAEGRMAVPGLEAIERARADGSWDRLNEVDALVFPADLVEAFDRYAGSAAAFENFPRSARRGILEWILQAKRPETRQRRVDETARLASEGVMANFPDGRNRVKGDR